MSVNLKPAVKALRNADKLVEGTKLRVLKTRQLYRRLLVHILLELLVTV